MKTKEDIVNDLAEYIRTTPLVDEVSGKICLDGERDLNPCKEDIVISVLANHNGQRQTGIVNVNVYFADQHKVNQYKKNKKRSEYLSRLCADIFEDGVYFNECWLELDEQDIIKVEATHEHMVNNRIIYTVAND